MIKIKIGYKACQKLAEQRSVTFKPAASDLPEIRIELSDEITFLEPVEAPKDLIKTRKEDMN